MSGWRTNRETGNAFPTDGQDSELDSAIERVMTEPRKDRCNCRRENHGHGDTTMECSSGFGEMLVLGNEVLCESCAYKVLEEEGLTEGLDAPTVQPSSGRHKIICSNCGQRCLPDTEWHTSGSCKTGVKNY